MDSSRFLIIGANGQLGTALRRLYPNARSADVTELDITDADSVKNYNWSGVEVILNAAAYTNVDGAETDEGRRAAWAVNGTAVANLARICLKYDIALVHVSSDYVFDGTKEVHDEAESFAPLGVYAQTKAASDLVVSILPKHYIVRTSWVIGQGKNFVLTMKDLAEKGVKPSVVSDQIGRLTFTKDLANGIKHLLDTSSEYGTYNLTNDGEPVSWAEIASDVYELTGHNRDDVTGITTAEYYKDKADIAPRPLQSTLNLDKIKATGFVPRDWREALQAYLAEQ